MLKVTESISAPAAIAWTLLTDTRAWPHWGPSVRAVDAPARFITAGMRGRVQTTPGPWLPFEITDWEEGTYWRWRVGGIPATGHRVSPDWTAALGPHVHDPELGAVLHARLPTGATPPGRTRRRRSNLIRRPSAQRYPVLLRWLADRRRIASQPADPTAP